MQALCALSALSVTHSALGTLCHVLFVNEGRDGGMLVRFILGRLSQGQHPLVCWSSEEQVGWPVIQILQCKLCVLSLGNP